ncbi:MAG: hypothetical protein ACQZ3M_08590 [cyanobacterium endosymbiont of Rhopalodia fuxianensis]
MTHYRYQLPKYLDALIVLDEIVVCDEDLEDIAINFVLAVRQ